jgi:hypothetical protein
MSFLKSINFHDQGSGLDAGYLWLSRNVDFIYSCLFVKRKISTDGLRKINVFLGPSSPPWSGLPSQGIVDIWVSSNAPQLASDPDKFQGALMSAAGDALGQISAAGLLSYDDFLGVTAAVVSTGLNYEYKIQKNFLSVADGHKATLWLRTRFSSVSLILKKTNGNTFKLLDFWPSPWLVLIKFIGARLVEDGRLQVDFRYLPGDGENTRFGMPVINAAKSELPVTMSLENISNVDGLPDVARFTFNLNG